VGGQDTKRRLLQATLTAIRQGGFAGVSARVVAGYAGVNQALIFYHYGSMEHLVGETCRQATTERVALWAPELDQVEDLGSLVALARRLHAVEAEEGNVGILAQALAAAHTDVALAPVIGQALEQWMAPLRDTAARILAGTVLDGVLSPADIARTAAAAFVGAELFDGVVPADDGDPFAMLERVAALGALVLEAGPITKAAVRRRLRSAGQHPAGSSQARP
jgi:AcrR family transcriptional regulator